MKPFADKLVAESLDGHVMLRYATPHLQIAPYTADIALKYYVPGVIPDAGLVLVCRQNGAEPVYSVDGTENGPEADMAVLRAAFDALSKGNLVTCNQQGPYLPRQPFDIDAVELASVITLSDPCGQRGSPFTVRFRYGLSEKGPRAHVATLDYRPDDGNWVFTFPAAQYTSHGWRGLLARLLSQWADRVTVEPYVSDSY